MFLASVVLPGAVVLLVATQAWSQGDPMGSEFRINAYTTNDQEVPAVASEGGGFVVVWQSIDQDGSYGGVFGQRYVLSGAPLGGEFRVNSYTTGEQRGPSVASTGSTFVVAWNSFLQDGSSVGVFAQRYVGGNPSGPEFRVNTYTNGVQAYPSVAGAGGAGGAFVIVWHSLAQDGSGYGVFGQRYSVDGGPLGPEFRVNTYTTGDQYRPVVAMNPVSGNFLVAWNSVEQEASGGIYGQQYSGLGVPLAGEFQINTFTTDVQAWPRIAGDSGDAFMVAWMSYQQDGSGWGIVGRPVVVPGGPAGPEFLVNTYTTGHQYLPAVAGDSNGHYVVVWQSADQDGDEVGVYAQRYSSSGGSVSGPEFRVNTYTPYWQERPSVAADGTTGQFLVTWDGPGPKDVYGQRFGPIFPVELIRFGIE
jgi:hypothetical protein